MRKLGILIGIIAVATLGFTGTASAQTEVCDVFQGVADESAGFDPSGNGGAPVGQSAQGAADSCNQSIENEKLMPSPLLCGVAEGLDIGPGGTLKGNELGTSTVGAVNDGLAENIGDADPLPVEFRPCGPTTPTTTPTSGPNGGGDDGGGGGAEVQAANAAADGGLPRTGGELFAGAGFGLASLGALIRRFLA